jgi:hypothetical protein
MTNQLIKGKDTCPLSVRVSYKLNTQTAIQYITVELLVNYVKGLTNTVVPPYLQVIRSKTYCGYLKQRIIPNAICNMIFV